MGGVKTIDTRAHGTQKTKTKAMCSYKTKKQAHGQQKKSPAMCKTGHEHAANENTHKTRVHTRHDNMKARSQWKTQAVCNTAKDITWMHAADKNTNCVQQHKTTRKARGRTRTACYTKHNARGQKSAQPSELETARSHNKTEHGARVSKPRHETETQDMSAGIRTPRSNTKQGTQTRARTWKQDMTGASGLCHKTMNNTRPKWQNPDNLALHEKNNCPLLLNHVRTVIKHIILESWVKFH